MRKVLAHPAEEDAPRLPKQRRSRERRAAMIALGAELLLDRDLDDISIADVTAALGYSTGSFYSAFQDKAAFFVAVHQAVAEETRRETSRLLAAHRIGTLSPPDRIERAIDIAIDFFRSHRGQIASALRQEPRLPEAWAPHRASGRAMSELLADGLPPDDKRRMRFAMQMLFGTLVNAVLHDPGPLQLDGAEIRAELKTALRGYLKAGND